MEHLYSAVKLLLRRRISAQEHLHFEPILSLIDLTCLGKLASAKQTMLESSKNSWYLMSAFRFKIFQISKEFEF